MQLRVRGFDWDDGNRTKCQKHGVAVAEIEEMLAGVVLIVPDEAHSQSEARHRAIGRTASGRAVFIVFTIRERGGASLIRPISARYMHRHEIESYEKENPHLRQR
ncbi:BrnT family toxin [Marinivivus vitaminiproducens]|uniref:BrnT family toxin n=1 Tax=Marinivivus vitaminiproducens TaxID=3035935 RepID=UPI0027A9480D|nr:BrnT family toxin [Geminicoccaceae bacterium SCSIO 64248]